jgi:hypothetical protein
MMLYALESELYFGSARFRITPDVVFTSDFKGWGYSLPSRFGTLPQNVLFDAFKARLTRKRGNNLVQIQPPQPIPSTT